MKQSLYHKNFSVMFADHLKCHQLIVKLNWNLDGESIVL